MVDSLVDISILSKGAITYEASKSMPYKELQRVEKGIARYYKNKAKAMNSARGGKGGSTSNLVEQ